MVLAACQRLFVISFSLVFLFPAYSLGQVSFLKEKAGTEKPNRFTTFSFEDHEKNASLINDFLWYHLNSRGGIDKVLFNKEYLTMSDLWLNDAPAPGRNENVQSAYRNILLNIRISPEGYVSTHQHFSHSNDYGWPFPVWTQAGDIRGQTAGWHFQKLENVPGWAGDHLRHWKLTEFTGQNAVDAWETTNLKSDGIVEESWKLKATGPSPELMSPEGVTIDAWNAPFLQLRWKRSGISDSNSTPYVEWKRKEDTDFSSDRRVYFYPEKSPLSNKYNHSLIKMYRHPKWKGDIKQIRIALAPGGSGVNFKIDSFFTVYDTRHTINNPIFILSSANYFNWTGDLGFLRRNINRMRLALRYQQTKMGGLKHNHIRNTWIGHNGLPGWTYNPDGSKNLRPGYGIGSNYWDLLPFGWDDMYATSQYYAATQAMVKLEEVIQEHPEWQVPVGAQAFDPKKLRDHAQNVKQKANKKFWNEETGRFNAVIDKQGNAHDYGFTFLNLEAIWYGIANEEHGQAIMDWLTGERRVKDDTSTGEDIYHWRFGPRSTTKRNTDWYGWVWNSPESIPWGGQVQDGGAVLGFTFYDLWSRLHILGADNAWQRFTEIMDWLQDVNKAGGYRSYYKDGKKGTTLQGCGTAGGLGIDCEFRESSLLPSIITYGFMGIKSQPDGLTINPRLPSEVPGMTIRDLLYHTVPMDIAVSENTIKLTLKEQPSTSLRLYLKGNWKHEGERQGASEFILSEGGSYVFHRL
jgi:hypothetical protein